MKQQQITARAPEYRLKISTAANARWNDPAFRAKMLDVLRVKRNLRGENNPMFGKKRPDVALRNVTRERSPERGILANRRMVAAIIGKPLSNEHRSKIGSALKGRRIADTTREKIRAAQLIAWSDSGYKQRALPRLQSVVMPLRDTKPELVVQDHLAKLGVEFQKHTQIEGVPHLWDLVIPSQHAVIEVDGCYWHGCPEHCPGANPNKVARDARVRSAAAAMGWQVIGIGSMTSTPEDSVRF